MDAGTSWVVAEDPARDQRVLRFSAISAVVGVAVFLVFSTTGVVAPGSPVLDLGREGGPVAYAAALAWAVASAVCAFRLARGQRRARALLLAWGLLSFVCVGAEVAFAGRGTMLDAHVVFQLGFVGYFLGLPALALSGRVRAQAGRVGYAAPHPAFLAMIWGVIAASGLLQVLGAAEAVRVIAASRETFVAFVALSYVGLFLGPR